MFQTKWSALLLAGCLLLHGCTDKTPDSKANTSSAALPTQNLVGGLPCSFPLVTDPASLNILITGSSGYDAEDVLVWKKYQEMTGVDVHWTTVTKKERNEAVYNALMNKTDLDCIIRCKISAEKLTQYGESGLILDLAQDDLLKTYAPNCWAYLQTHPEALASVTNPDGTIYALPQVNSGAELRVGRKLFVNKQWLERLNLQLPTTTEELYRLLLAFQEQDANGNGDPNDEIPLCSQDWLSIQDAFFGAFGLGNRGLHNTIVDCDEATGKVRLIAASDGYRDYLTYFNRLYAEGLLDSRVFTMSMEQWTNSAANDQIGVFANTNLATLPADKMDNWVAIEEALEGPNGDKLWAAVRANFHSTGAAVIPTTCENPALILRWLDYFWTDTGTLFYHLGVEGETYVANGDGTYDYAPRIYEEIRAGDKSFDEVVAAYSPYPGGCNPTVEITPYFMGGEMAAVPAQAARALFAYGPKEYWPSFTFTTAENDRLGTIQSDLDKYCSAARVEFISGTRPLSDWEAYLAQLDKLGADELLSVYQAAADRYATLEAEHPAS